MTTKLEVIAETIHKASCGAEFEPTAGKCWWCERTAALVLRALKRRKR